MTPKKKIQMLWFDVGIKRHTTLFVCFATDVMLWFDVGIKRHTTKAVVKLVFSPLWFDVGIKRHTTARKAQRCISSCGLM